ncbi:hypothetical protein [Micromonospora sp. M42]|uniref:hypothetical protein n=1 Tax=Micromonospora sp. M42 TaxID=457406 RepID=UPI0018DE3A43|nr:hypothetical protein [Micromonospora sp. M42]
MTSRFRSSRSAMPCGLAQVGTGSAGWLGQETGSSAVFFAAGISASTRPSGPSRTTSPGEPAKPLPTRVCPSE